MSLNPGGFPSTIWTEIRAAGSADSDALERIVSKYRPVVVSYARRAGVSAEDAEDVAQDVFLCLVSKRVLHKASEDRGRFRDLLTTIVRRKVAARWRWERRRKRGGGRQRIPLEEGDEVPSPDSPETGPDFDALWVQNLVRIAMDRMDEDPSGRKGDQARALRLFALGERSYAALAEKMETTVTDVRNLLHHARRRLKTLLREEIAAYCSSSAEFQDEVEYVKRLLG